MIANAASALAPVPPAAKPLVVLLTGATGFLGSQLCRSLLEAGHSVAATCRHGSDFSRLGALADKVRWYRVPEELEAPFSAGKPPDAIVHCAALYGRRGESPVQLIEANILLPVRLHHLACRHGVPRFLNTDTVLDPSLNLYALGKHHAAQWLMRGVGPTRVLNLKVQHFYGPGDDATKFVTGLITRCLANVPEIALTDGLQQRDFIYVTDVVGAMLTLLNAPVGGSEPKGGFATYEIGSGSPVRVRDLAELIHRLTRSRSRLNFGAVPYRPGEPMLTCADTSALQTLGWRPQVQLPAGLARTIEAERAKGA